MLNEEALILLGTLIASGLLVLGVANLVWPPRKKPVRRATPPVGLPARAATGDEGTAADAVETDDAIEEAGAAAVLEAPEPVPRAPARAQQLEIVAPATSADTAPAPPDAAAILERCRTLVADSQFGDAVALAMPVLRQPGVAAATVVTSLWVEVAGARDRMGDRDGALDAFRSAVETAADDARDGVRHECASWAAMTARDIVASVPDEGDRYGALATARAFIAGARDVAGAAAALDAVRADLDVEFWPAYESHVRALITDRDHAEAYRLSMEALSDDALPAAQRATFEEFRSETLAARIVALADRAVLAVDEHREWEAVGALERAETLLRSASSVTAERRDEVAGLLAAAYTRLGRRRVEGSDFEEAVDPLLRALRISKADTPARDDARAAMVRALTGVVDARVATIRDVAASGNRESAAAQGEKLWTLLRSSMAAGVPQEPLTNAIATTRRLLEEFGGQVT